MDIFTAPGLSHNLIQDKAQNPIDSIITPVYLPLIIPVYANPLGIFYGQKKRQCMSTTRSSASRKEIDNVNLSSITDLYDSCYLCTRDLKAPDSQGIIYVSLKFNVSSVVCSNRN